MQLTRAQIIVLIALIMVIIVGYLVVRFSRGATATVTLLASSVTASSPAYNPADQSVYFLNRTTEQLSKVDPNGTVTVLSDRLPNVDIVLWSPDFSRALIRSINDHAEGEGNPLFRSEADDGLILTWLYALDDRTLTFVHADYGSVLWAGTDQIVYYFAGDDPGDISLAKPDGLQFTKLARIDEALFSELVAYLPNQGLVMRGGVDEEDDKLYFFYLASKELTVIGEHATAWVAGPTVLFISTAEPTVLKRFDTATRRTEEVGRTKTPISHIAIGALQVLLATEDGIMALDLATKMVRPLSVDVALVSPYFVFPGGGNRFYVSSGGSLYMIEVP